MTFFINQQVITPYGRGIVETLRLSASSTDESMVIVRPYDWVLANEQKPIFYLNVKDVQPVYPKGCVVSTVFGVGEVHEVREDGIYIVRLKHWILANNKRPTLFLNESSLTHYKETEVSKSSQETDNSENLEKSMFEKQLQEALTLKNEANEHFKKGELEDAKSKYIESVTILRELSQYSSLENRVRVLEQLIPCHNNIALCCFKIKDFNDSIIFANHVSEPD